jgi:sarcosine oxidase subunit gamma
MNHPTPVVAEVALRVSPLRAELQAAGWVLRNQGGVEVWDDGSGREGLTDLSTCDRIGLKGRGAAAWLAEAGVDLPTQPNRLLERADGVIVARLSDTEFVLADFTDPTAAGFQALRAALEAGRPDGCYEVPRAESQAVFGLVGDWVHTALSAVCPADLRPTAFPPGGVLQSQCAGVGAQLWNLSKTGLDRVVLSCDASLAVHVWNALRTCVAAAGGTTGSQATWFRPR